MPSMSVIIPTDINECLSNPCTNDGTCVNGPQPDYFTCNCVLGWVGLKCETGKRYPPLPISSSWTRVVETMLMITFKGLYHRKHNTNDKFQGIVLTEAYELPLKGFLFVVLVRSHYSG